MDLKMNDIKLLRIKTTHYRAMKDGGWKLTKDANHKMKM